MLPLRRSTSSLSSLSQMIAPDSSQSKILQSSSSLSLHSLLLDSSSPTSSFDSHSSLESLRCRNRIHRNIWHRIVPHDHTTFRHATLAIVAIPCCKYLNELAQTSEVWLHNIPFLIALGVFPTLLLTLQRTVERIISSSRATCSTALGTPSSLGGIDDYDVSTMLSSSLAEIEAFYRNHPSACDFTMVEEVRDEPLNNPRNGSHANQADEWGHFTDFDDAAYEQSESLLGSSRATSRSSLHTLQESEEEEEEEEEE